MAVDRLRVEVFVESYAEAPEEIVLDLDATDDPLHGEQEGRFFHGYYGDPHSVDKVSLTVDGRSRALRSVPGRRRRLALRARLRNGGTWGGQTLQPVQQEA